MASHGRKRNILLCNSGRWPSSTKRCNTHRSTSSQSIFCITTAYTTAYGRALLLRITLEPTSGLLDIAKGRVFEDRTEVVKENKYWRGELNPLTEKSLARSRLGTNMISIGKIPWLKEGYTRAVDGTAPSQTKERGTTGEDEGGKLRAIVGEGQGRRMSDESLTSSTTPAKWGGGVEVRAS